MLKYLSGAISGAIARNCDLTLMAAKRLLNRHAKISYAQSADDLMAAYFLRDYEGPKVYVDVGCNHPRRLSNTYWFYLRGWAGVAIDGNPCVVQRFRMMRPRDTVVHALVSNEVADHEFVTFEDSAVSSLSPSHIEKWQTRSRATGRLQMTSRQLNDILREEGIPSDFGFLSIDVEGHDIEVLQSIDLANYSPALIIIECHADYELDSIVSIASQYGYKLAYRNILNAFFLRS